MLRVWSQVWLARAELHTAAKQEREAEAAALARENAVLEAQRKAVRTRTDDNIDDERAGLARVKLASASVARKAEEGRELARRNIEMRVQLRAAFDATSRYDMDPHTLRWGRALAATSNVRAGAVRADQAFRMPPTHRSFRDQSCMGAEAFLPRPSNIYSHRSRTSPARRSADGDRQSTPRSSRTATTSRTKRKPSITPSTAARASPHRKSPSTPEGAPIPPITPPTRPPPTPPLPTVVPTPLPTRRPLGHHQTQLAADETPPSPRTQSWTAALDRTKRVSSEREPRWSYLDKEGKQRGPMTWAHLMERHQNGTVDDATLVFSERLSGGFSRAVDIDMRGPEPFSRPTTPRS